MLPPLDPGRQAPPTARWRQPRSRFDRSLSRPPLAGVERMTNRAEMTRRDILESGAAASTVTLAPGVTLMAFGGTPAEASSRADAGKRWGLLIDASKCSPDCSDCVTACKVENGWGNDMEHGHIDPDTDAQWIRKVTLQATRKPAAKARPGDVPALRRAALRRCLPDRRLDASASTASSGRQAHLHRLPLLHDGLPVQGAQLRARDGDRPEAANSPRGKGTVESCNLCVHRVSTAAASRPVSRPARRPAIRRSCSAI